MKVVFLGGGRITSAMLAGLRLAKTKHRLIVHDRNPAKLRQLKRTYAIAPEPDLRKAVDEADVLLLAVRPGSVAELLHEIGKVSRPRLAVSLAAGVPLRVLRKGVGAPVRWARAMPSPVCRSGRGLTAVTFPRSSGGTPPSRTSSGRSSQKDRQLVREFFAALGPVVEIPESKFDAFTVVYSCSHGYHALATLAKCAQDAGLDRKTALLASAHALADGIIAWREGSHPLEALLAEAATPDGISAAALAATDAAGYRRAVRKGVAAGLRRARANARESFAQR